MALIFDKEGNLIRDSVNFKVKHNDLTNDLINELINEYTEKYFCSKCDTYHKRMYRGKISQTFIYHQKYVIKISDSYMWKKQFKKSCNRYDSDKHRK